MRWAHNRSARDTTHQAGQLADEFEMAATGDRLDSLFEYGDPFRPAEPHAFRRTEPSACRPVLHQSTTRAHQPGGPKRRRAGLRPRRVGRQRRVRRNGRHRRRPHRAGIPRTPIRWSPRQRSACARAKRPRAARLSGSPGGRFPRGRRSTARPTRPDRWRGRGRRSARGPSAADRRERGRRSISVSARERRHESPDHDTAIRH